MWVCREGGESKTRWIRSYATARRQCAELLVKTLIKKNCLCTKTGIIECIHLSMQVGSVFRKHCCA